MELDLYYLITQGQFSVDNDGTRGFPTPHGFFIYVKEEIIEVPVRKGGSSSPHDKDYHKRFQKKRKITLRFEYEGNTITKEVIVDNENLSVKSTNIQMEEGIVELNLYNITFENSDIVETIKVNIIDE